MKSSNSRLLPSERPSNTRQSDTKAVAVCAWLRKRMAADRNSSYLVGVSVCRSATGFAQRLLLMIGMCEILMWGRIDYA